MVVVSIMRYHLQSALQVSFLSFFYPAVSRLKGETGLGEVKVSAVCGPAASRGWGPGLAEEPTRQQVLRAAEAILDWLSEVQP